MKQQVSLRNARSSASILVLIAVFFGSVLLGTAPAQAALRAQPALLHLAAERPHTAIDVIVQKLTHDRNLEAQVAQLGGTITRDLTIINAFTATVPGKVVPTLATSPDVRWMSLDAPTVDANCTQCVDTTRLKNAYPQTIGATRLWNEAPYLRGKGITAAVVDSGIAPHNDLKQYYGGGGDVRVKAEVHLNSTNQFHNYDDYGHGTHVAGIIGGNGTQSKGVRIGVAPKVDFVDVHVGDDKGMAKMSDLVAGLEWIYKNKDLYKIRVVNLSMNSSVAESYHTSPLNAAVEILWFNKIVVVVAAGNNGTTKNGILYPPANDPFVITVGATDDKGTATIADDVLAAYSAYGTTESGFSKPDILAPGTNIISLLSSTSSVLPKAYPKHFTTGFDGSGDYFRMSGTSMAAPVVSGAVALLLQDEPTLTPDQVKHRLKATGRAFISPANAPYLDIYAAVKGTTTQGANKGLLESKLLNADGSQLVWDSASWGSASWGSGSWGSASWGSASWGSTYWDK